MTKRDNNEMTLFLCVSSMENKDQRLVTNVIPDNEHQNHHIIIDATRK